MPLYLQPCCGGKICISARLFNYFISFFLVISFIKISCFPALVPCPCLRLIIFIENIFWTKITFTKKFQLLCALSALLVPFLQDFWSLVSPAPWRTKYDSNLLISSSCVLCPPSFYFPRRLALSPRGSDEVARLLLWRWLLYFQLKRLLSSIVNMLIPLSSIVKICSFPPRSSRPSLMRQNLPKRAWRGVRTVTVIQPPL